MISEGVAKLKSLTLIRLRSDDDKSKGYVKRIKTYILPWTSRGNNSELFTVNLTDTPSEAPVIVARHDDLSRVWRKCEYLVLCWRIFVNSTSLFILIMC